MFVFEILDTFQTCCIILKIEFLFLDILDSWPTYIPPMQKKQTYMYRLDIYTNIHCDPQPSSMMVVDDPQPSFWQKYKTTPRYAHFGT